MIIIPSKLTISSISTFLLLMELLHKVSHSFFPIDVLINTDVYPLSSLNSGTKVLACHASKSVISLLRLEMPLKGHS